MLLESALAGCRAYHGPDNRLAPAAHFSKTKNRLLQAKACDVCRAAARACPLRRPPATSASTIAANFHSIRSEAIGSPLPHGRHGIAGRPAALDQKSTPLNP